MRLAAFAIALVALVPQAAPPPATEVYLAPLTIAGGSPSTTVDPWQVVNQTPYYMPAVTLKVGTPINISNSPGYDNQPSFLPNNSGVLFTSNRDGKQTDIYRYDIKSKAVTQLTHTDENEYSPLVTPDGKAFSVVRGDAQQLWRFDLDGSNPKLVYAPKGLIGYHAWIDATHLAVYVLGAQGAPNTLQLIDLAADTAEVVDTTVGRSILVRPGKRTVSYISRAESEWTVKEFNPKTKAITPVFKTPARTEDSAWTPDGRLVMAQGSALVSWHPGETAWTIIADLSTEGFTGISRLAVSRDGHWMAIVALPKTSTTTRTR
jgi:dipeptidyl aminopeptidase/acylaminoacyl peptidase